MAKDRVLIVEDDRSLILFYKGVLAALNVKIDTASSYDNALAKLKDYDYIFHIIDITLDGDEPGTQLIGKAGAGPEACLIVSASMTESLVTDLIEVHGVPRAQIITKPVDADQLIEMVAVRLDAHVDGNVINNHNHIDDDVDDVEEPRSKFHAEKVVTKYIIDYLADHKIRTLVFIVFLMVFFNFFITFLKIDAYNEIDNVIRARNTSLFQHYNLGDNTSGTTYSEINGYDVIRLFEQIDTTHGEVSHAAPLFKYIKDRKHNISSLKIKFYPDGNYMIIIRDGSNNTFRHVWVSNKDYLNDMGIGKDLTLLELVIKAWAASFKNF